MDSKTSLGALFSSKNQQTITKIVIALCGIFLLWDWYASYEYYRQTAIFGDVAGIAYPHPWYADVLEHPFGWEAVKTGEKYAATNRFWAHFITKIYFNNIPFLLQDLGIHPINSIYVACSLLKLLTQIGLILLLSKWVLGKQSIRSTATVVLAAFITSFFLTADTYQAGFDIKGSIGIIDQSIAYTLFYATSLLLLMFYLHPFLQRIWGFKEYGFSIPQHLLLAFLAVVISFNGPTSSPVILIICPLLLLGLWLKNFRGIEAPSTIFHETLAALKKIPPSITLHFTWVILLNIYSFYVGTFNLENPATQPSLEERYTLLFQGFYREYIWNDFHIAPLGVLFILIGINTGLIVKFLEKANQSRYLNTLAFVLAFFIVYTFLLPLGGYRNYRPLVIRYDVIMPTTLGLFFLFFHSCYLLWQHFKGVARVVYTLPLLALVILLTVVDSTPNEPTNQCEYAAIEQFANSKEQIVALPPCAVLSWDLFRSETGIDSETVSKLLYRWHVIEEENKRFYNLPRE